jgi:hypothetical protein
MFRGGIVKNQLTVGPWYVGAINTSTKRRSRCTSRRADVRTATFCTTRHLYRVGFDGTGLTLLTPEDANHDIEFSPSGKYFVDSYSRIEKPPVSVLRAVPDGHVIRKLEEADISARRPPAGAHRRYFPSKHATGSPTFMA